MAGQIVILTVLTMGACAETALWAARKIGVCRRVRRRLGRFG